jgi:hypothetical protein
MCSGNNVQFSAQVLKLLIYFVKLRGFHIDSIKVFMILFDLLTSLYLSAAYTKSFASGQNFSWSHRKVRKMKRKGNILTEAHTCLLSS